MKKIIKCILVLINILMKLLIIPSIITEILIIFLNSIFYKRISDLFNIGRRKNIIYQSISFKMFINILKNDYYIHKRDLICEIEKINIIELMNKNKKLKGRVFKCNTNNLICKCLLDKKIDKNEILVDDASEVQKRQPLEKLSLMSPWVIWKNIFNKKFWKYIFHMETLKDYYFKV